MITEYAGLEPKERLYQDLKRILADNLRLFRNHPMSSTELVAGYETAASAGAIPMWDGLWIAEEVRNGFRTPACRISPR